MTIYFQLPPYLSSLQTFLTQRFEEQWPVESDPKLATTWVVAPDGLYRGDISPDVERDPMMAWIHQLPVTAPHLEKLVFFSSDWVYGYGSYVCGDCGPLAEPTRNPEFLGRFRWEVFCPICKEMAYPMPVKETSPLVPTTLRGERLVQYEHALVRLAEQVDFPIIRLRLFSPYWPNPGFVSSGMNVIAKFTQGLLEGETLLIYEEGYQMRDFLHGEDLATLLSLILDRHDLSAEVYNAGSGDQLPIQQVAAYLQEFLEKTHVPYEITESYREGDVRHRIADITKAQKTLGYEPRFDVIGGLADYSRKVLEGVNAPSACSCEG